MGRRRATLILVAMLAIAAAVRLNNVLTFPALRAFDGFGHFIYIWFMADEWRVPLATTGWSFFHPPLYYALMASLWTVLAPIDAVTRLTVGTGLIAMLGLTHGIALYAIARRYFPGQHLVHLLAAGLMFFLPVHLYTAGFLGNENLHSILGSLSLVTLLWVLRRPSWARGAVLGLLLGTAMLTKFTAIAIVAGTLGTLAVHFLVRRHWRLGTVTLATATVTMLVVCGWFYARNVLEYGTPFKLSRDEFMVAHVENYQSKGRRNFWEYVLFDPVILRRPQWPRGLPLTGEYPPDREYSALRESVITGVYANTWFDGGTGNILPPVTMSEESRRAGQILLTLAVVPTVLVVVGIGTALRRLWRDGWNDTLGAMLLTFAAMVVLFVQATSAVPMHAAVKATYLTPVSLVFGFWFALGADRLRRASRRWFRRAAAVCALLAVTSVAVFTTGRFVARGWLEEASTRVAVWQNLYGIVHYAGGDRERARELFVAAAEDGWHLAEENLGFLLLQDGRPLEALYHVRSAAQLQPRQSFGTRADRARFNRTAQAEYRNQMAVIYYEMGWLALALEAADQAHAYDSSIPEIEYDLAVLKLARALARPGAGERHIDHAVAQSRTLLLSAAVKDPGFHDVTALTGALDAMSGDCEGGVPTMQAALSPPPDRYRRYPVTTGPGNVHAASLRRRPYVRTLPEVLRPEYQLARCSSRANRH